MILSISLLSNTNMGFKVNKQLYKQCTMERQLDGNSKHIDVAWIPTSFAKVGRKLSIKNSNDEWVEGWTVMSVGGSKDFDELKLQRDAQKRWERVLDHGVRE